VEDEDGGFGELLAIAQGAKERSAVLLEELVRGAEDGGDGEGRRMRDLLEMFRGCVRVSGEIYLVDEPNRGAS
jgi:hypothetical protein